MVGSLNEVRVYPHKTDPDVVFSAAFPDRAIKSVQFGFAMYHCRPEGSMCYHCGITDAQGAKEWLEGKALEEVRHYKVFGLEESEMTEREPPQIHAITMTPELERLFLTMLLRVDSKTCKLQEGLLPRGVFSEEVADCLEKAAQAFKDRGGQWEQFT